MRWRNRVFAEKTGFYGVGVMVVASGHQGWWRSINYTGMTQTPQHGKIALNKCQALNTIE
jgi:hypothetical protein